MVEDSDPGRGGEYLFSPEYWDGHSLQDDCPWVPTAYRKGGLIRLAKDIKADSTAVSEAWEIINGFLQTSAREPIKTFRKGEVFEGSEHPLGTVVRLSEEFLSQENNEKRILHKPRSYWGVLIEGGADGLTLVKFSDYAIKYRMRQGLPDSPNHEVGTVSHLRRSYPRTLLNNPRNYQVLNRTPSLQIIGFGKTVRKPVQDRREVPVFGQLKPQAI